MGKVNAVRARLRDRLLRYGSRGGFSRGSSRPRRSACAVRAYPAVRCLAGRHVRAIVNGRRIIFSNVRPRHWVRSAARATRILSPVPSDCACKPRTISSLKTVFRTCSEIVGKIGLLWSNFSNHERRHSSKCAFPASQFHVGELCVYLHSLSRRYRLTGGAWIAKLKPICFYRYSMCFCSTFSSFFLRKLM